MMFIIFTAFLFSGIFADTSAVQHERPVFSITAEMLEESAVSLSRPHLVMMQDVPEAHLPDFDDSEWEISDSYFQNPREIPDDWEGIVWYRLHLEVDSALFGKTYALPVFTIGANKVFLNGELLIENGVVSSDPDIFEYGDRRSWTTFTFEHQRNQVLAIQFANPKFRDLARSFFWTGTNLSINKVERSRDVALTEHRFYGSIQWFIIGFCSVFSIIHFLFFLFNRRLTFNLWFALTCAFYAFSAYIQQEFYFYNDALQMITMQRYMQSSMVLTFLFTAIFLYSLLNMKTSLFFRILTGFSIVACVVHAFVFSINPVVLFTAVFIGIHILYIALKAIRSGADGSWVVGSGVIVFIVSIFTVLGFELAGYQGYSASFNLFHIPYLGFGIALVAMSVQQSRHLAKLNLDLRKRLIEVRELSDKNLHQERSIREAEVQRVRLETENERKSAELEKARELQLSLLPASLPVISGLEMHAEMLTATEVGGDYYDFIQKPDGTLIWALGDATGHGTQAGFLAAMTKTLFQTIAGNMSADDALREMSAKLKEVGMKGKFMCLGLLTINGNRISWCSAGIPAAIILRAGNGETELMESKGMPLGTAPNYPYQIFTAQLEKGDVVLLMTDGLMEQMNADREQFGEDRILTCLKNADSDSPKNLISALNKCLHKWRDYIPQEDDATFVCLKVK